MLFKVGNEIIDTEVTPVGLIFKDEEEANVVANIISTIKDNGDTQYSTNRNGRWWFHTPANWTMDEKDKWSVLTDEQKDLLESKNRVTGKLDFQL